MVVDAPDTIVVLEMYTGSQRRQRQVEAILLDKHGPQVKMVQVNVITIDIDARTLADYVGQRSHIETTDSVTNFEAAIKRFGNGKSLYTFVVPEPPLVAKTPGILLSAICFMVEVAVFIVCKINWTDLINLIL